MRISVTILCGISIIACVLLFSRNSREPLVAEKSNLLQNSHAPAPVSRHAAMGHDSVADPPVDAQVTPATVSSQDEPKTSALSAAGLVKDGSLASDMIRSFTTSEQSFDGLLQLLSAETSIEASKQQMAYENLFLSDPSSLTGAVQVSRLTCGRQLCAASVAGVDPQELAAFVKRVYDSKDLPMYALIQHEAVPEPGSASKPNEQRLIFSTDRSINSVLIPPRNTYQ